MNNKLRQLISEGILKSRKERNHAMFWAAVFSFFYLICNYFNITICGFVRAYQNLNGFLSAVASFFFFVTAASACEIVRSALFFWLKHTKIPQGISFFGISLLMAFVGVLLAPAAGGTLPFLIKDVVFALLSSILLSRLVLSGGAAAGIVYAAATKLPLVFPIYASNTRFLSLCLDVILPIMFLVALECSADEAVKKQSKGKDAALPIAIVAVVMTTLLFSSGVLPVRLTSIATGSMSPELNVGDMAIVSAMEKDDIFVGDVIQFHKNGVYVLHRVDAVEELDGQTVYLTKGDANQSQDAGYVTQDAVMGKVIGKVPYIGYFTLWLHSV